jgi:hypothetical protein
MKTVKSLLKVIVFFSLCSLAWGADQTVTEDGGNMVVSWKIEGDNITFTMKAKTTGWVAVGFNPTTMMKDANILIGRVKKGKAKVEDHFGISSIKHKKDKRARGKSNVSNVSGSEENGWTTLSFTIPLDSKDKADQPLDPKAETTLLLAYGKKDSFKDKHSFVKSLKVKLAK